MRAPGVTHSEVLHAAFEKNQFSQETCVLFDRQSESGSTENCRASR